MAEPIDAIGSTIALTDATANIQQRYDYEPYGAVKATGTAGLSNPYQYTGRENDGDGLYYYRARYYNPVTKRFVSEDPLQEAAGINSYSYVSGNPVNLSDPLGLFDVYAKGLPHGGYTYDVKFYGQTGMLERRFVGVPSGVIKKILKQLQKNRSGAGVSDTNNFLVERLCDSTDAAAEKIFEELGLDDELGNISESQLRDFLNKVIRKIPETKGIYNPDRIISEAQDRAFPPSGYAGQQPSLIPPGQDP